MSQEAINIVVTIIGSLLTLYILPWLHQKAQNEKQVHFANLADMVVAAAEQQFGGGQSAAKRAFAEQKLTELGVPAKTAGALVEAAVHFYNIEKANNDK